ncbi:MAG: Spy/CpxP family protein refolding chaperone [Desulfomonilia bacterium]
MKKSILGCILILGFLCPISLMGNDMVPGRWWRLPRVSQELDLSETDKEKLDELYVENRRMLIDLKGNVEKEQFEIENLMEQEPLDDAAVMEHFGRLDDQRGKLALERFRYLVEVRKILGLQRYQKLMMIYREFEKRKHTLGSRWRSDEGRERKLPAGIADMERREFTNGANGG